MVWITRLTLIAYLVGGWLLPASHFHAHSAVACQGSSHVHSTGCDHDHGHDHPHVESSEDDSADLSSESSNALAGGLIGQRAVSDHCHSGLCAICAARTLASATIAVPNTVSLMGPPRIDAGISVTWILPTARSGAHWLRGPPEFA
ncbi:hypothetical protein Poly51_42890 [Rubripirellula tenax]|uniref:Uncharacterized protein n=1 Tax=Rubripirellula tenax TaxID=2528015 RepID=A0A5C6ETR9_9BACT|nr:hypothetical protein [Rubripirellula tenax]TWU50996.1 hypothetical protein Poly51_42890 [Rubripirellula tenax]